MSAAIEAALEQITTGIGDLRSLITELRPAALDELGVGAGAGVAGGAVHAPDRRRGRPRRGAASRYAPEIESTVYRLVQEALTNVAKHSRASRVAVSVVETGGVLRLTVRDDGAGFDARDALERVRAAGDARAARAGQRDADVSSSDSGTTVSAVIPAQAPSSRERSVAAITASRNAARTE